MAIFMTPKQELVTKDRVVVVIPGQGGELGCWSFWLQKRLKRASKVAGPLWGCRASLLKAQKDSPGLIVA